MMKSYNEKISDAFYEIGDLMSLINENPFKIRAYYQAARRLRQDFRPITKKDTKQSLMEIPGIGDALADKIIEYMKDSKIDYLDRLRAQIPKAVRDMLKIPHLGPNRVRDLYINLGIKTKADLKKHAKSGKIAALPGFGDRLVEQILDALQTGQKKKKRHARSEVEPIAKKLVKLLTKIPGVRVAVPAGSYRRGAPTVGDLDILVVGRNHLAAAAEKAVKKTFKELTMLASGEPKVAFVIFPENLQIDIRFIPRESYGSALLYFTGSKEFNVMMRRVAIEKGMLLNEYGLFKDGEYVAGKTEEEVFKKLGIKPVPPEIRK
jgi:DNA polymerase (family 10)